MKTKLVLFFIFLLLILPLLNGGTGDEDDYDTVCTSVNVCSTFAGSGNHECDPNNPIPYCNACYGINCNNPPSNCYESAGTCIIDGPHKGQFHCVYNPKEYGVNCGTPNEICDGDGKCICVKNTCSKLGKQCYTWSDGCGGTLNCGSCPSHYECITSTGKCNCVPDTCDSLGKNCGEISDGCGIMINCGTCDFGNTCNSGNCNQELIWQNMLGDKIIESDVGDSVLMVVKNAVGYSPGDLFNFTISENGREVRNEDNPVTGKVLSNGDLVAKWTISNEEFGPKTSPKKFKFFVKGLSSEELNVNPIENNSPPKARIIRPILDSKYKTLQTINFDQFVIDEDDDLYVTWNFGDGVSKILMNCLTGLNCNTTYEYNSGGVRTISLTAKEITRAQYSINYTKIFLFENGINVFAIISKPKQGEKINGTKTINFLSNNSFVANCSSIRCPCPDCPDYVTGCYLVNDLYCFNYMNNEEIINRGNFNLWLNWNFSEGAPRYGNWSNNYNTVVDFNRSFRNLLTQSATLKIGYQKTNSLSIKWSENVFVSFDLLDKTPTCDNDETSAFWVFWNETTGNEIRIDATQINPINPLGCYRMDGNPSTTCCPLGGGRCDLLDGSPTRFSCSGEIHPTQCSEYKNSEDCRGFEKNVAVMSVERRINKIGYCDSYERYNETCYYYIDNCRCEWSSTELKCNPEFTKYNLTCGGIIDDIFGKCLFKDIQKIDQCNTTNYLLYKWSTQWSGLEIDKPSECSPGERRYGCEESTKLPFFDEKMFILSLIMIIIIYTIFNKKISRM